MPPFVLQTFPRQRGKPTARPHRASPAISLRWLASPCAEAKGRGLGLFEEVGDFGEECWEVVFDG